MIVGKATIFLTLCLHSAVDELLWQCSNKSIRKPSENVRKRGTQFSREASVMRVKIACMIGSLPSSYSYNLFTPSPLTPSPSTSSPHPPPSPFTPSPSSSLSSSLILHLLPHPPPPHLIHVLQPIRRQPKNLPHITFYHPPSPRESSRGGGGEEGGSVGEESRRESLASPTSTGRESVGEEPPAERYGGCALNLR